MAFKVMMSAVWHHTMQLLGGRIHLKCKTYMQEIWERPPSFPSSVARGCKAQFPLSNFRY